ncbi:MAG: PKD domain-containing protein, partial [Bacteroidales bacterium]|nr:PKD domain-containing protein [Bacteroidales bacterium]
MTKYFRSLVIVFLFTLSLVSYQGNVLAQSSSLNGKEYIFLPDMYSLCNSTHKLLNIYSKNANNVMVKLYNEYNVEFFDTLFVFDSNDTSAILNEGFPWSLAHKYKITSTDSLFISFSYLYYSPAFETGTLIPTPHRGNKYIIPGMYNSNGFSLLANAFNNNTDINIIPTADAVLWSNFFEIFIDSLERNVSYSHSLQESEILIVDDYNCYNSLVTLDTLNITKYQSGLTIQSENCNTFAVAVSSTIISSYPWQYQSYPIIDSICLQMRNTLNILSDTMWSDPAHSTLAEDLFPVNTMGRKYICSPPPNGCEIVSFTTPYDNTIIRINGIDWDTLNKRESRVKLFTEPAYIEASHPFSVAISHSFMKDSTGWFWGGAGFIQIPSIEQFAKSGWFFYPSQKFISNSNNQIITDSMLLYFTKEKSYILVVTPTIGVNQTLLNNFNIGSLFQPLTGNPQYSTARIEITTGFNELSNPNGLIAWSTSYHTRHNTNYLWGSNTEAYQCYGAPLVMSFNPPTYEAKINTTPIENTLIDPYTICLGTPLQYTVVTNADSNLTNVWEFGDGDLMVGDTVFHTYADTGYYHVNLFVNSYCDTIKGLVHVVAPPTVFLGNDTIICQNTPLTLNASVAANADYLWNTGSSSPQITVNDIGEYSVKVTTDIGCVIVDTINVDLYDPINVFLGNDTIICYLGSLLLDATQPLKSDANYMWQDFSTNSTYTVIYEGQYWVVVSNLCTQQSDTINIEELMHPTINLGNDT